MFMFHPIFNMLNGRAADELESGWIDMDLCVGLMRIYQDLIHESKYNMSSRNWIQEILLGSWRLQSIQQMGRPGAR